MRRYSKVEDDQLLIWLKAGDEQAFTEIYNRYWQKLLAISYYHTGDKQAAEDIVHDVMSSLWNRKNKLAIQSLNAYLGTAVKYSVFKLISRNKKHTEMLSELDATADLGTIEQKLDAKFLKEYLQGAIEELPEKARIVFRYSREEYLTVTAIADKMDLSPKAVEYHITKALKILREMVKKIKTIIF